MTTKMMMRLVFRWRCLSARSLSIDSIEVLVDGMICQNGVWRRSSALLCLFAGLLALHGLVWWEDPVATLTQSIPRTQISRSDIINQTSWWQEKKKERERRKEIDCELLFCTDPRHFFHGVSCWAAWQWLWLLLLTVCELSLLLTSTSVTLTTYLE